MGHTGTQTEAEVQGEAAGDWLRPRPRNRCPGGGPCSWALTRCVTPGKALPSLGFISSYCKVPFPVASFDEGRSPPTRPRPGRRESSLPGKSQRGGPTSLPELRSRGRGRRGSPPTEPGGPDHPPAPYLVGVVLRPRQWGRWGRRQRQVHPAAAREEQGESGPRHPNTATLPCGIGTDLDSVPIAPP